MIQKETDERSSALGVLTNVISHVMPQVARNFTCTFETYSLITGLANFLRPSHLQFFVAVPNGLV